VKKIFRGKFRQNQRFAAVGVGVGPFVPGSPNESYSRDLFATMDFAAVRDDESMRLCQAWNVHNPTLRTDLCFLPELCWPGYLPPAGSNGPGRRIGVIVRDWPHDAASAAFEQPLLGVTETLRKSGYTVRYIIFRANGDPGWAGLLSQKGESLLSWNPEVQTISDFLHELNQFDCLVTARYHGALFAALLGKPVICIELEQKLRMASELLEAGLWKQPFAESLCLELVERVFANYRQGEEALARVVREQRQLGQAMMNEFLEFAARGKEGVSRGTFSAGNATEQTYPA
jgi:polysaccharide pyruvyl transferase WcaK-like protein